MKNSGITVENFAELAQCALTQVVLYNRRRPGETQFFKAGAYRKRLMHGRQAQPEVLNALSLSERVSIDRLSLIYIRGKRDRGVSVVLTNNMTESITILCNESNRKVASVNPQNLYIFATNHFDGQGPQRSHDCLRRFAKECNAQYPQTLTATSLRKQIATMCQLLNLKNHELEQLTHHLGHDISVHRQYYRLPNEAIVLAKVSKLLMQLV